MKKTIPFILISLIIAACTTMPAEIDDKYLVQKTDAESKNIVAMENRVIEKNKEKQAAEKRLNEQAKLTPETEKELRLLKDENQILKDQISLYEKNRDTANLEAKKAQLKENENQITIKTALLKYQQTTDNYNEAELDLRNAELAKYIAELNLAKSKIAAEYRDKHEPAEPEEDEGFFSKIFNKKDPNDKYGYKKYGEYLDKTEQDRSKAEKKYLDAKASLEKLKS